MTYRKSRKVWVWENYVPKSNRHKTKYLLIVQCKVGLVKSIEFQKANTCLSSIFSLHMGISIS